MSTRWGGPGAAKPRDPTLPRPLLPGSFHSVSLFFLLFFFWSQAEMQVMWDLTPNSRVGFLNVTGFEIPIGIKLVKEN